MAVSTASSVKALYRESVFGHVKSCIQPIIHSQKSVASYQFKPQGNDGYLSGYESLIRLWQIAGDYHYISSCKFSINNNNSIVFDVELGSKEPLSGLDNGLLGVEDLLLITEGVLEALQRLHGLHLNHNNITEESILYDTKNKLCQLSDLFYLCDKNGDLIIEPNYLGQTVTNTETENSSVSLFDEFTIQVKSDLSALGRVLYSLSSNQIFNSNSFHFFPIDEFIKALISASKDGGYSSAQDALDDVQSFIRRQLVASKSNKLTHNELPEFEPPESLSPNDATDDERTIIYDSKLLRRLWVSNLECLGLSKGVESELLKVAVCLGDSFKLDAVVTISDMSDTAVELVYQRMESLGILTKYQVFGEGFYYRFNDDNTYRELSVALTKIDEINIHQKINKQIEEQTNLQDPEIFIQHVWHRYKQAEGVQLSDSMRIDLMLDSCKAAEFEIESDNVKAAFTFAETALNMIQDKDWSQSSESIYEVFERALSICLVVREIKYLLSYAESFLENCTDKVGSSAIVAIVVRAHYVNNNQDRGIGVGLNYLRDVGVSIPIRPTTAFVLKEFIKAKLLLARRDSGFISKLPLVSDSKYIGINSVIRSLMSVCTLVPPPKLQYLLAVLSCVGVQLSLKYGVSSFHSTCYANLAKINLVHSTFDFVFGGLAGVQKYIEVSRYLEKRFSKHNISCGNELVLSGFVYSWADFGKDAASGLTQSALSGLSEGDLDHGSYAVVMNGFLSLVNGRPIRDIRNAILYFSNSIKMEKQSQLSITSQKLFMMLLNFIAEMSLEDRVVVENTLQLDKTVLLETADLMEPIDEEVCLFAENYLSGYQCVLEHDWVQAYTYLVSALVYIKAVEGQQSYAHFIFLYLLTMVQLRAQNSVWSPSEKRKQRKYRKLLSGWSKRYPDRYNHWEFCIRALDLVFSKDALQATAFFEQAISCSQVCGNLVDSALIAEFAAVYCVDQERSTLYLETAYRYYESWGAKRRIQQLDVKYPQLRKSKKGVISLETSNAKDTMISIVEEQATKTLFGSVLTHLMTAGGFEKIVLLQSKSSSWNVLDALNAIDGHTDYPEDVIRHVEEYKKDCFFDLRQLRNTFSTDPYIKEIQPLAIGCFPIMIEELLVGVLYCEHRSTAPKAVIGDEPSYLDSINLIRSLLASSMQRGGFSVAKHPNIESSSGLNSSSVLENQRQDSRDLFLAKISHDCITPASAIIKYAEFALNEDIPLEQRRQYMQSARDSAESMLSIVKSMSQAGANKSDTGLLIEVEFNLPNLLARVLRMLLPSALDKNIELQAPTIEPGIEALVGDAQKIQQVMVNLLTNAIKYTPSGSINVIVSNLPNDVVLFSVEDTGAGVPAHLLDSIFQQYNRVDNEVTNSQEGVGLGLTICKEMIAVMGGDIWVESEINVGSQFKFSLPLKGVGVPTKVISPAAAVFSVVDATVLSRKIVGLVVDDNIENAKIAQEMLRINGVNSDYVLSGGAALQRLGKQSYDFVLLDIEMPEMDGFEVARVIRVEPSLINLSIIAYTAGVGAEAEAHWADIGFNAYVSKSESSTIIVETIVQSLGRDRDEVTELVDKRLLLSSQEAIATQLVQTDYAINKLGWSEKMFTLQTEGFVERYEKFVMELPRLIKNKEYGALKSRCHMLKSAALYLGVSSLSQLAMEIEEKPEILINSELTEGSVFQVFFEMLNIVISDCKIILSTDEYCEVGEICIPAVLKKLALALQQESPEAIEIFRSNRESLYNSRLGESDGRTTIDRLQTHINNVNFRHALQTVELLLSYKSLLD